MITSFRAFAAFAIASFISVLGAEQLQAQSYPSRPVTIVVPSAAGGGTDTVARLIGDQLGKQLGQSFVVRIAPAAACLSARRRWRRRLPTATRC